MLRVGFGTRIGIIASIACKDMDRIGILRASKGVGAYFMLI